MHAVLPSFVIVLLQQLYQFKQIHLDLLLRDPTMKLRSIEKRNKDSVGKFHLNESKIKGRNKELIY